MLKDKTVGCQLRLRQFVVSRNAYLGEDIFTSPRNYNSVSALSARAGLDRRITQGIIFTYGLSHANSRHLKSHLSR